VALLFRLPVGESLRPFEHPPFYAFIGSVALATFSAIAFTRLPAWSILSATLLLSVLFVWWGWFMQGAPLVLHELHTFDPGDAAKEVATFRMHSIITTAIMLAFFVLLPLFHHLGRRRSSRP
jgi:hypothetical protein